MTLSLKTLSKTTLGIMTLSIRTSRIMTSRITIMTISIIRHSAYRGSLCSVSWRHNLKLHLQLRFHNIFTLWTYLRPLDYDFTLKFTSCTSMGVYCKAFYSSNFGAMTISITTFNIKTLKIKGLFAALTINNTQHNSFKCHYAEWHNAERRHILLLCWVSFCWVTLFGVLLCLMSWSHIFCHIIIS
jgi:hypothetical protein